ncbi:TnsA endonuclease N-terminal domain-containing protein [Polynucleobacter sp. JS-Safj-400b-B2]|uniref:TnsA endonuclease N-terminal domain-containing protein n=1 Tax=Polynucleobacter sp. JS-Safj-400b-B2 TaxID=2576921 RepID=UPI001C0C6739|nr:TnsA endonuclease N-terminal domain-containing protein [Polynucleobacter sp. JS-Safj-400b-B2]
MPKNHHINLKLSAMAVRKIPKNHLFVTGRYASAKNGEMRDFESLNEKDYLILLDFDPTVASFEVQPVKIPVPGVPRGYVPDVLVHFHADESGKTRFPLLVDVKHTNDLAKNAAKYAPKFEAARIFAQVRDWEFQIIDETTIRTPYLSNLKFLRAFKDRLPETSQIETIVRALSNGSLTFNELLDSLASSDQEKLSWIPAIWHMVITQLILADLQTPISGDMLLELPKSP